MLVEQLADAFETKGLEVEFDQFVPIEQSAALRQDLFGFPEEIVHQSHQVAREFRADPRFAVAFFFDFLAELGEIFVERVEFLVEIGLRFADQSFEPGDLALIELCREHFARPIDEIMRFVDQKGVLSLAIEEEALEIGARVEDVVVIAGDNIGPQREVQREFKGADFVLLRVLFDYRTGKGILLEDIFKRVVDAVVITDGEFALLGVAGGAAVWFEADFVARG